MSYLDDIVSRTKSVAEVVGKKSAEAIEVSKKRIELIDNKNRLTKSYAVLGQIQYDLIDGKEPRDEFVEEAVKEIEKYREIVERLEGEINELSSKSVCEACGAENKYGSMYCTKCGAPLS